MDQPTPLTWRVRFVSRRAEKEWHEPRRTHPLKGTLQFHRIGNKRLAQWQHEITGAGRIWYCIDREERVVWIVMVSLRHPRETGG